MKPSFDIEQWIAVINRMAEKRLYNVTELYAASGALPRYRFGDTRGVVVTLAFIEPEIARVRIEHYLGRNYISENIPFPGGRWPRARLRRLKSLLSVWASLEDILTLDPTKEGFVAGPKKMEVLFAKTDCPWGD